MGYLDATRSKGDPLIDLLIPVAALLVPFIGTGALMPLLLKRLRSRGMLVQDMYKSDRRTIVNGAGLIALSFSVGGLLISLALSPAQYALWAASPNVGNPVVAAQLALITIAGYGIVGAFDDRFSLSHLTKALVPVSLSISSVAFVAQGPAAASLVSFLPWTARYTTVACIVIVPVYILVVSNLVNMHSGFNGLQSGLSLVLLATLALRVAWLGRVDTNLPLLIILGCTAAFYPFNRNPAKAIEGNVGSFLVGSAIGVGIVANGLFLAGGVMLAPHILDFVLFAYSKTSGRHFIKFGSVRPDGTIEPPYPYKLKFLFPYYFRLTEAQTVRILLAITAAACALSFLVPV